ncbi:magnesium and cobalt transport protein CorA [Rhizobacter sp. AJA081-3]|uniref:magnesium and cobalt transport protein CorA n=1 Tax=Rhizobacter sp. AJA081-3 TaxID=2753607 RepID=UPI001AE009E7|nr:magnesium and cobalt transport protein CorA [Rhizobacter sp. AJA081-3]QTN25119.1 magnesium and cobalt transport protein CorA [Rhizobacter sp. AJA081-3]
MTSVMDSVVYRDGARISDVAIDDIGEVIKQPGTFVWLGLHEPDDKVLQRIQHLFGLHELAIEDAHHAHQRPKIEAYSNSLFIVLKTAQLESNHVVYGETHLFVGPNFLVSVRHGASSSYAQVLQRCEDGTKGLPKGPGFALYAVLDFVADNYQPVVAQFERDFDAIETDIFKDRFDRLVIERLYALKRNLLELRNAALPLAEISSELMRLHEDLVPKELRAYFRDIQDHVSRLVGLIDGMRDMLTTAMQVNLALVANNQNEVVKRLAGWGAILAIPTVVFSLYGMNFQWMPELKWKAGYPMAVAFTALCCILVYRRLRRAGWV